MTGAFIGVGIVIFIFVISILYMSTKTYKNDFKKYRYKEYFRGGFKNGLPIIKFKINGNYHHFIVDSGANQNAISEDFYNSMTSKPSVVGESKINDTSSVINGLVVEQTISYRKNIFNNIQFNVIPFKLFDDKIGGKKIIGVIGSPFMAENRWMIDFDEMVVWIK